MSGDAEEWERIVRAPIGERPVLQKPSAHRILRKIQFPDMPQASDRRLILPAEMLRYCLAQAEASPLKRAVMHGVCVEVEQYVTPEGHIYEIWSLVGQDPVPEQTHRDLQRQVDVGQIKKIAEGRDP